MNNDTNAMKFILTATPTKFTLKYRNKKGEIKTYRRITPIETLDDALIAYVFKDGENKPHIRRFNFDGFIEQTVAK